MSSPRCSNSSGASTQASAGMLRSRIGVAGRSAVWTGVGSMGRWSAGRAIRFAPSPAPVDPLLQVRCLRPDRGVVAVARHHDVVRRERGEQPVLDRVDDLVEVAALVLGGTGAAGEQGVAAE